MNLMKKRNFGSLKRLQRLAHRRHRLADQMKEFNHKKKRKIILLRVRQRKVMLGLTKKKKKMEKAKERERYIRETRKNQIVIS